MLDEFQGGGDAAAEEERLRLTADVKRLSSARWSAVKDIVRRSIMG